MISKTARLNFVVVDCGEAKEKWILIVMRLIFFLMQRHELRMLGHFGHIASCYGKSFKAKGGFFSIIFFFLPLFFFNTDGSLVSALPEIIWYLSIVGSVGFTLLTNDLVNFVAQFTG